VPSGIQVYGQGFGQADVAGIVSDHFPRRPELSEQSISMLKEKK
jgi:hypothetical protein